VSYSYGASVHSCPAGNQTTTFQATVQDAPLTSAGVSTVAGGGFDVTGTHTYNTAGNYLVNTTITDIGTSSTSATSTAQITVAAALPPADRRGAGVSGPDHETEAVSTTTGFWERLAHRLPVPVAAARHAHR
jgi:PKD repeat protein